MAPPDAKIQAAKAFFKEFDDHTLHQRGPFITQVYGGNRTRVAKDIFDGFSNWGGKAIRNQIREANGKPVKPAHQNEVTQGLAALKNSGVLTRLSQLQLLIIKKHYKKAGTDDIDFAKFQCAMDLFANGELRGGGGGARQMDQLFQFLVWAKFAEAAVSQDVDKAQWEKLLKTIETGMEIYRRTYPAPSGAGAPPNSGNWIQDFYGELQSSDVHRFDASKQLSDGEKTSLRAEIAKLTTAQIVERQKTLLDEMTNVNEERSAGTVPTQLVLDCVEATEAVSGFDVSIAVSATDSLGQPAAGREIWFVIDELAIAEPSGSVSMLVLSTEQGAGAYTAEVTVSPYLDGGLAIVAVDTGDWAIGAIHGPLPHTCAVSSPTLSAGDREAFVVGRIWPNPTDGSSMIKFRLPETGVVSLGIYDVQGRMVRTFSSDVRDRGDHSLVWDGKSDDGGRAANGVYFYRLVWNGISETRRVTLMR